MSVPRNATFIAVVVSAALAAATLLGLDTTATARQSPCAATESSHELARNQYARVYTAPRFDGLTGTEGRATFYCTYATGEIHGLDIPESRIYFGQALHLNGRWLGYVADSCGWETGPACRTRVVVVDIGSGPGRPPDRRSVSAVPGIDDTPATLRQSPGLARVGSLRVRGTSMAFITCPSDNRDPLNRRKPDCRQPGTISRVLTLPSGAAELHGLDEGRQIDPDSLRLSGSRLSWRHSGRRRTATLE